MCKDTNAPRKLPHKHGACAAKSGKKPAPVDSITGGANKLWSCPSAQRACAQDWIKSNGDIWAAIVRMAQQEAAAQRRFSMNELLAIARFHGAKIPNGDVFKVNNNCIPALSRILDEMHPELARWHEKRKSACDWSFQHED